MRVPVVLAVLALVAASCSDGGEGPVESSADDVPPRTPTTTAPPLPTGERVTADGVALGGAGDQRITGVVAGPDRMVAVGTDSGRAAVWTSADGRAWQRSGTFPEGSALHAVAAAGPGFVAGGDVRGTAAIWVSRDGRTWQGADVDPGPPVRALGATAIGLVAVAGGERPTAWQSEDAQLWLRAPEDDLFERPGAVRPAAVFDGGPGALVLVDREGSGAELWATPDGIAWTDAPISGAGLLPGDGTPSPVAVATRGDIVVAAGAIARRDGTDAAIWTSAAARSWEAVPHRESVFGGDGGQRAGGVAIVDDSIVAAGTTAAPGGDDLVLWDSGDDGRWRAATVPAPGAQHVAGVAALADEVVVAGWEDGPDGDDAVIWRIVPDPAPVEPPAGGGLLWVRVPDQAELEGGGRQWLNDVAVVGSQLLAVGAVDGEGLDGGVWRSDDGGAWDRVGAGALAGPGDQEVHAVAATGNGAVAVGRDGDAPAVWRSPDGRRWSRAAEVQTPNPTRPTVVRGVAAGPDGTLVAVGRAGPAGDGDAVVWRSSDGRRWDLVPGLAEPGDQAMHHVVAGEATFVAAGVAAGQAAVWQSTDGLSWQRADLGPGVAHAVAVPPADAAGAGPVAAVVAGAVPDGDGDPAVWLRVADGWQRVPEGLGAPLEQTVLGVTVAARGMAVAVGTSADGVGRDAAAWSSSDGLAWQRNPHDEDELGGDGPQVMTAVVVRDQLVLAVGWTGDGERDAAVWVAQLAGGGGTSPL